MRSPRSDKWEEDRDPVPRGLSSICMILIHESHVFELRRETKFELYYPHSFFF